MYTQKKKFRNEKKNIRNINFSKILTKKSKYNNI